MLLQRLRALTGPATAVVWSREMRRPNHVQVPPDVEPWLVVVPDPIRLTSEAERAAHRAKLVDEIAARMTDYDVRAYTVQNAAADKPTRLAREVIRKKARALADKITPQKSTYANVRVHAEAAMMGLGCTFCTDSSAEQARAALGFEQAETDALKAVFTVCSLA